MLLTRLSQQPPLLRRGFPRSIALLLLVVTAFATSGPIRALTGWPLGACLPVAVVATAAVAAFLWRARDATQRNRAHNLAIDAAMLGIAVLVFAALYVRAFGGLVVLTSSGIPDAGNHVLAQHVFVERDPGAYMGFVSLFAFVEWLKRIARCDDFSGFVVATYVALCVYACAGIAAAATALDRFVDRPRPAAVGVVTAFVWSAVVAVVVLPFLHYHHAQGFFPPIFALLPLLGMWFLDALVRQPAIRFVALAALVVIYRFSYGLNLPDLLLALAAIALLDGWPRRARGVRIGAVVGAIALLAAAMKACLLLRTVFRKPGPFDPYDRGSLVAAELLMAGVLIAGSAWPRLAKLLRGSGIVRWMRLPVILAVVNGAFLAIISPPPRGEDYYYLKSSFHPVLLLLAASVVFVTGLASGFAATEERTGTTRSALACAAVGLTSVLLLLAHSFAPYRPSFRERAVGRAPYRLLRPVADRHAWRTIARTLASHHARFGGYLTSYYPTFNFMNASFDYWNGGIAFYWGAPPAEKPGYCVFWEGGPAEARLERVFPQQPVCDRLSADPRRTCESYLPPWDPAVARTLCWICP